MSALKYYDTTTGTWKYLAQGVKGDKGDAGTNGTVGATGPANVLSVNSVTSGATASATITGTSPSQQLNLVLPKGDTGQGFTAKGVYAAGTTYAEYDVVYYPNTGNSYRAKSTTIGNLPTNATYWELLTTGWGAPTAYSSSEFYAVGNTVTNAGNSYYCISAPPTSGYSPTNTNYWIRIAQKGDTSVGLPTGGSTSQVLVKTSSTDYAVSWQTSKSKFEAFLANVNGPTKAIPAADTSLISSTSTSAISGATVYAYNSGKFTFRGLNATTYTNSSGTTYYRNNAGLTSAGDVIFNQFWVEFDYYGSNFDLRYNNNQSGSNAGYPQFWIWIDGVPTTASAVLPNVSSNVDRFYQVVLPSTKQRRVRILLAGLDFGGIGVKDITETVFPVNQQLLKVAFIDASWLAGSNGGATARNCANQLAVQLGEMLNVDYYNLSVPGTGYVNGNNTDPILGTITNSGGNGENWCSPNRLSPLSTISPDLIIIQGTTNDDAYTGASYRLSDHATYVYDQIKNTYAPNAKIIVFTRGNNGYTSSSSATNASTVYAAASAHSSVIGAVDIYGESWVAGFYNSGTSTWTTRGNGEVLINTSDLHPNADGNKYYASRIFDRTYDIIKSYARS
jgi:hypothetical protein